MSSPGAIGPLQAELEAAQLAIVAGVVIVWPSDVRDEFERADRAIVALWFEVSGRWTADNKKAAAFSIANFDSWFTAWRNFYNGQHDSWWLWFTADDVMARIVQYEAEERAWRKAAAECNLAGAKEVLVTEPPSPPPGPGDWRSYIAPALIVLGLFGVGYAVRSVRP
jgi:hypothetical protein